jgi:hypothetical protein
VVRLVDMDDSDDHDDQPTYLVQNAGAAAARGRRGRPVRAFSTDARKTKSYLLSRVSWPRPPPHRGSRN